MNLYEINADMQRMLEESIDPETGEIVNENLFADMEALSIAKNERIEYLGLIIKNQKAEADMLKATAKRIQEEADSLKAKAQAIENNNERIKGYIKDNLAGEKFKTSLVSMYYHPSDKLIADEKTLDFDKVPAEFIKKSLFRDDVKKAILNGATIEGCEIEHNVSLVVR